MRINELDQTLSSDDFRRLKQLIVMNCSEYLNEMRRVKRLLYRGVNPAEHQNKDWYEAASRMSRQPTDNDPAVQAKFDYFLNKLGSPAKRGNSTFVTSSITHANAYGDVYVIFPFNGSPYAWSYHESDLILSNDDLDEIRTLNAFQGRFDIQTTKLGDAMLLRHEVWFKGKYIALNEERYGQDIKSYMGLR